MDRIELNFYERDRQTEIERQMWTDTCSQKPCENKGWGTKGYSYKPRNIETRKGTKEILPSSPESLPLL